MKTKFIPLLIVALLLLSACGAKEPPASSEPAEPPAQTETPQEPAAPEGDGTVWELDGYTLKTPKEWSDWLVVDTDGCELGDTIFALYYGPSQEAGEGGWLLSVRRWDEESYQEFISADVEGMMIEIATDSEGYLYGRVQPSDVQILDIDTYNEMVELVNSEEMRSVLDDFVSRNGLTAVERT